MFRALFVTIFQPAKSATQSGLAKNNNWHIKLRTDTSKYGYKLMNWVGSKDPYQQLNLSFETKDAAISFVESRGWNYKVVEPQIQQVRKKSYAENFK